MGTWEQVMACKKAGKIRTDNNEPIANDLDKDELNTIMATVDYFGGSVEMTYWDLTKARYRLFDWIAMCVMGNRINSESACKVLAYAFLDAKGDVDKFIENLRSHDYDLEREWEKVVL